MKTVSKQTVKNIVKIIETISHTKTDYFDERLNKIEIWNLFTFISTEYELNRELDRKIIDCLERISWTSEEYKRKADDWLKKLLTNKKHSASHVITTHGVTTTNTGQDTNALQDRAYVKQNTKDNIKIEYVKNYIAEENVKIDFKELHMLYIMIPNICLIIDKALDHQNIYKHYICENKVLNTPNNLSYFISGIAYTIIVSISYNLPITRLSISDITLTHSLISCASILFTKNGYFSLYLGILSGRIMCSLSNGSFLQLKETETPKLALATASSFVSNHYLFHNKKSCFESGSWENKLIYAGIPLSISLLLSSCGMNFIPSIVLGLSLVPTLPTLEKLVHPYILTTLPLNLGLSSLTTFLFLNKISIKTAAVMLSTAIIFNYISLDYIAKNFVTLSCVETNNQNMDAHVNLQKAKLPTVKNILDNTVQDNQLKIANYPEVSTIGKTKTLYDQPDILLENLKETNNENKIIDICSTLLKLLCDNSIDHMQNNTIEIMHTKCISPIKHCYIYDQDTLLT